MRTSSRSSAEPPTCPSQAAACSSHARAPSFPNGMEIAPRKVGGVESNGMICSEVELGHRSGRRGIFVVDADLDALPGTPVADALDLRDVILDIGLTPNRPDCLGHVGIAREIGVLFGRPYEPRKAAGPRRVFDAGASFEASQPTVSLQPLWDTYRVGARRNAGAPQNLGGDRRWRSMSALRRCARLGRRGCPVTVLAPLSPSQLGAPVALERRRCHQTSSCSSGAIRFTASIFTSFVVPKSSFVSRRTAKRWRPSMTSSARSRRRSLDLRRRRARSRSRVSWEVSTARSETRRKTY